MEYTIPRKLIDWNIKFGLVYLEFLKNNSKNIRNSLTNQIFQEHINSVTTGIILPKQLQGQLFKVYSKGCCFLKISTKLQIESLQFQDLMILRKFNACFDPSNFCRFL